jgi:hypothetical protein
MIQLIRTMAVAAVFVSLALTARSARCAVDGFPGNPYVISVGAVEERGKALRTALEETYQKILDGELRSQTVGIFVSFDGVGGCSSVHPDRIDL